MTASDRLVGRLLERRYRVDALIARGGMATVYEATDLRLERQVALKVMRRSLADDEAFTHRLAREARASANLAHPHIVGVYDHGEDEGVLFLAMEFVPGRKTLRDLVRAEAPLPPGRALALVDQILQGIEVAHEAGIVHRDLKPENVLLNPRGQVKVADFGLARAVSSASTVTATGAGVMGTVAYLPPELVTHGRADARSDVYALGVMTYELLTGVKPHDGDNPMQIAYAHVHHDIPPPSRLVRGLPDYVDAFVARSTARDRDRRPADAHVMRHQLGRVRHAIDQGVVDDEDLAADLSPTITLASGPVRHWADDVPGLVSPSAPGPGEGADDPPHAAAWHDSRDDVYDVEADDTTVPVPTWSEYDDDPAAHAPEDPPGIQPTRVVPVDWSEHHETPADPDHREAAGDPADQREPSGLPPAPPRAPAGREQPRRRRGRGWLVLLLVLVLAALAAFAGWWLTAGRYSATPDVTGLEHQRARQTLARAGFSVAVDQPVYSEDVPRGAVVVTRPEPAAKVLPGAEVALVLSRGPERHRVPALQELTLIQARQALLNNSLRPGLVTWRWSEQQRRGHVMSTSPETGTRLRPDTRVDLVVSRGRRPIDVRSFVGQPADQASAALADAGLRADVSYRYHGEVPEGTVISQSPSSGTLFRGDGVDLVVSQGPHLVEVPSVRAEGLDSAEQELRDAGFRVERQSAGVDLGLGVVVSQSPGSGDEVPYGSTVTLTVT